MVARRGVADTEETLPDVDVEGKRGGEEGDHRDDRSTSPDRCREDRLPGCKPPPDEEEGAGAEEYPGIEVELEDGVETAVVAPKHLLKVEDVAEGEHKEPRDAEEVRE